MKSFTKVIYEVTSLYHVLCACDNGSDGPEPSAPLVVLIPLCWNVKELVKAERLGCILFIFFIYYPAKEIH